MSRECVRAMQEEALFDQHFKAREERTETRLVQRNGAFVPDDVRASDISDDVESEAAERIGQIFMNDIMMGVARSMERMVSYSFFGGQ